MGRCRNILKLALRGVMFSASTLVGTAVDTAVLYVCAHMLLDGTYVGENIISPTISFVFATFANYIVQYFWVWRDRMTERTVGDFFKRYCSIYFGTCVGAFLIKMFFLQVFCLLVPLDVVINNLLALCFSGLFNFFVSEFLIFKKK